MENSIDVMKTLFQEINIKFMELNEIAKDETRSDTEREAVLKVMNAINNLNDEILIAELEVMSEELTKAMGSLTEALK